MEKSRDGNIEKSKDGKMERRKRGTTEQFKGEKRLWKNERKKNITRRSKIKGGGLIVGGIKKRGC